MVNLFRSIFKGLKVYKRFILLTVLTVFFWHLFATIVYVTEARFTPAIFNRYVGAYMLPWFHQDWKLFAPEPPMKDLYMYYKVQFEDKTWSDWRDPARPLIAKHQANRFGIDGHRYVIHDMSLRLLYEDKVKYESHEDYPEILKTTWANKNAVQYFQQWSEIDYPNQNIIALRFATVNVLFNPMKDRYLARKIELDNLYPIVDIE